MLGKVLDRALVLLLISLPLSASNAYELLPRGRTGAYSDLIREEIFFCREQLARMCDAHPQVLDVFDRFLLTMASDGAFDRGSAEYHSLLEAIPFAAAAHSCQIRKCMARLPYIIHPLGVAFLLWHDGHVRDVEVLVAAILHDTVEDTEVTLDEIEDRFGYRVANIVAEVTDDKSLPFEERKVHQIADAPYLTHEAKLVKLADKLYNIRDVGTGSVMVWVGDRPYPWSGDRCQEYLSWAQAVVEGLQGTNAELEAQLASGFALGVETHPASC